MTFIKVNQILTDICYNSLIMKSQIPINGNKGHTMMWIIKGHIHGGGFIGEIPIWFAKGQVPIHGIADGHTTIGG